MSSIVINPGLAQRSLTEELRELWSYRGLVWTMIERDLRVRYKGSVLGILWSMINPLMQAFVLTIVMGYILNAGPKNQSAYILCAFIPWMFFQTAVLDASQAILSQVQLIKKVYFPREIPVIATTGANLIHLLISLGVFVVYRWGILSLVFHKWPGPPPWQIVFLPVVVIILFLLALGISLIVASLNVFYEDVKYIVTLLLQFAMYLSAVMYPVEFIFYSKRIPAGLHSIVYHLYLLNPISWTVTAFKQMFFPPQALVIAGTHIFTAPFNWHYCLSALLVSMVICGWGYRAFNGVKWRFTERP